MRSPALRKQLDTRFEGRSWAGEVPNVRAKKDKGVIDAGPRVGQTGFTSADLQTAGRYADRTWKDWNCQDKSR